MKMIGFRKLRMFPILIMIKYGTPDFFILDEFWKKQKNGTCIVRHTLFVLTSPCTRSMTVMTCTP